MVSCILTLNDPNALIGIPPGIPGAGIFTGFLVPHLTWNSFVFINSTSALSPDLNPNLNPFNVDKKGIIWVSIS